jgi:hypothetical protein
MREAGRGGRADPGAGLAGFRHFASGTDENSAPLFTAVAAR